MCQNSLLLITEDSRSESLIFLGVSLCGLVSMYSSSLCGCTERSIKDAISSDEQNHTTMYGHRLLHCSINSFICLLGNKNLFHRFIGLSSHKVLRVFLTVWR